MAALCHSGIMQPLGMIDPDAQLMMLAKRGDNAALDSLIRKHRAPVLRYAYRLVRDRAAAEDIAQEVFLRVHRYRSGYEVTAKFTTWLYRIAGHTALNWIRDHARAYSHEPLELPRGSRLRRQFVDNTIRIDEWLAFQSQVAQVRSAVNQLPERQRIVVVLNKYEGMACEEIAERMGCTNQAVRSTLCRAYHRLRASLAS